MYWLFECVSSGCVAQKGDHSNISYEVIQRWDRRLAQCLNRNNILMGICQMLLLQLHGLICPRTLIGSTSSL